MPDQSRTALMLTTWAGLSTLVGGLSVLLGRRKSMRILSFALGGSAGVMIFLSIGELLPEALSFLTHSHGEGGGYMMAAAVFIVGMLLAAAIDSFVPDQAEISAMAGGEAEIGGRLERVGIVSMIAIVLHNIPEGVATFMAGVHDLRLGTAMAAAVALHNIPEGVAVSMPIYYGSGRRVKALFYALMAGAAEPFGGLLASVLLGRLMNDAVLGMVLGGVAGIMTYISFAELLPASRAFGHTKMSLAGILMGMALMALGGFF